MSSTMMERETPKFQIDPDAIVEVRERIAAYVRTTPVLASAFDPQVFFKAENLQVTGSFKVRPAFAQLLKLPSGRCGRTIVTSSSGNFAAATAYAASRLGLAAKIVMMRSSNPAKIARTHSHGGEVVFCEDWFEARAAEVARIVKEEGCVEIYPYDHPDAVLGNATVGFEVLEQYPEVENLAAPVSGGGLLAGIAAAVKMLKPSVKVWGVQAEGSNATYLSFQARDYRSIERARTIADGLMVTRPGRVTFPLVLEHVDGVVTVAEGSILEAVKHFLIEEKLVVEPSGAVPLAAVMEGKIPRRHTVLVVSGGNISTGMLLKATEG